jgi:hypothetical protein
MAHPLPRTDYIAFIDEAGDFELDVINPNFPVCAQCAVTSTVEEYLTQTLPNLLRVKYSFFGNECVVMHGHKIRKKAGPFQILKDDETFSELMDAISWCFQQMQGCMIIAAVDKLKHKAKYVWPDDPLFLSLQFLLERLHDHWRPKLIGGQRLLCVFERRGEQEDKITRKHFDDICAGKNYRRRVFPFDADFRPKEHNVAGHQYADLAAYAASRYVETRNDERKDWKAVRGKLRTVGGEYLGHGLKIFPA